MPLRHQKDILGAERPIFRAETPEKGPWIRAVYPGDCVVCGWEIEPGDEIRSDGRYGWEGRCCEGESS